MQAIRDLQMRIDASTDDKEAFRIFPIRVGDGEVDGIGFNTIVPDVRTKSVEESVDLIVSRLRLIHPDAGHRVYLAECPPGLNDPTQPVNRQRLTAFFKGRGWIVLPTSDMAANADATQLEEQLRPCVAFVQLLDGKPWLPDRFDQRQNETAKEFRIPRLCYLNPESLSAIDDDSHKSFLAARDMEVVTTGFDDFLLHVEEKLNDLIIRGTGPTQPQEDDAPQVRVVFRSKVPESRWDDVYSWLYDGSGIEVAELKPDETFVTALKSKPCHGFVIACDAAAFEKSLSPDAFTSECKDIQWAEKDAARRPPVAVVFWPPPAPSPPLPWSRLLRTQPVKLHKVLGDAPENLGKFIEDVREVWRATR